MNRRSKSIMAFLLFCLGCAVALLVIHFLILFIGDADDLTPDEQAYPDTSPTESTINTVTKPWQSTRIKFFETSDIHGHLVNTVNGDPDKIQYRMAYIANRVRKDKTSGDYDDVLLVDAGDWYLGNSEAVHTNGGIIRAAFDEMDYDALTLGNHEFDWGVTDCAADPDGTLMGYEVSGYKDDPDIPVLGSNLYYKKSGKRVEFTRDYCICEKGGVRIAVIGYIVDYSASMNQSRIKDYKFDGDLANLSKRIKEINAVEKPDVTVVLCHKDAKYVADNLDHADVDIVAGGHTHIGQSGYSKTGIAYVQPEKFAQGYCSAIINIDPSGNVSVGSPVYNKITANKENLYDTAGNADKLDREILQLSHDIIRTTKKDINEVLGYITTTIDTKRKIGDHGASTAGNWVTGLMLDATKDQGTVAAFINTGALKTSFKVSKGAMRALTIGDIYRMLPKKNRWLVYELTGDELRKQIINGLTRRKYGDQVSGLTFEYENKGTRRRPDYVVYSITFDDGTVVDFEDKETLYRVCTTDYNATVKGSVFKKKKPIIPLAQAPIDSQTVIDLLREHKQTEGNKIKVNRKPRGTKITEPSPTPTAAPTKK